nr:hypothetical protein [Natronococcus sp. CG52]
MWQDLVFLAGSVLSIVFLAPTIRDATARIPLGSSVPSMTIGAVYAFTYATMGMTFSALGSLGVATMWSLIVCYRSPRSRTGPGNIVLFVTELFQQGRQLVTNARTDRQPAQSDGHQPAD